MNDNRHIPHNQDSSKCGEAPIRSVVTMIRPAKEELARYNRAEKVRKLREYSAQSRMRLLEWIEQSGLTAEVIQVSEPTAFNILFLVATPHATAMISAAPGVARVEANSDLITDIPGLSDRE